MLSQLDEMVIRQRYADLNERLERLYVPIDEGDKNRTSRLSITNLRRWLAHAGANRLQRHTRVAHGTAGK